MEESYFPYSLIEPSVKAQVALSKLAEIVPLLHSVASSEELQESTIVSPQFPAVSGELGKDCAG